MKIGSHLSISGGLHNALLAADAYGMDSVALFVRNQRQWAAKPLADSAVEEFLHIRQKTAIAPIVAHGSYLVNLAGASPTREKSIAAVRDDVCRCGRLGIEYLVLHPGTHADEQAGLELIAQGLDEAQQGAEHSDTMILLETTAGQGKCIGHRFEHLRAILDRVAQPERYGVCLDTAHIFAAGYDIRTAEAYEATMAEFAEVVGFDSLKAIHCNDSLKAFGSRVDRHAHIGLGEIGLEGFRCLVNDLRLADIPLILETPKGKRDSDGADWDTVNMQTLQQLQK